METDKARGEYHDPDAGKTLFSDFGKRWPESRVVDPSSILRYETAYRLHVCPAFGYRQVRAIKPSHIQSWIGQLSERFEPSTVIASFLVLQGILDLAVADGEIKKNPAKSPVVQVPVHQAPEIQIWADDVIACLIDAHPDSLRALPELAASCGMREGELFGISLEDFDFDEKIVRFVGRLRDSTASTYSHCLRMTVSESSRYRTGISRPSDGMSRSTRPGRTPFRGKSWAGSHTRAASCSVGPQTDSMSKLAVTPRRSGSLPWSRLA
jgi:integrase